MDRFIAAAPDPQQDDDLMLCPAHGVAWQADRKHVINYDADYYAKCAGYEQQAIGERINAARIALVERWFSGHVLDVGIGSGDFIKHRPLTHGYDINPVAIEWLKRNDLYADNVAHFGAVTMWDVIEHLDTPERFLKRMALHSYLFVSLPVFEDLAAIRQSKHYRPGEHLYYWTAQGFTWWMHKHGFMELEHNTAETDAGREAIHSFAFKRNRWPPEYAR